MAAQYDAEPSQVRQFALLQIGVTALFVLALFWILGGLDAEIPPLWHWIVLLGSVAVAAGLADRVWLSAEPLDPDDPAAASLAVGAFAAQTVRKLVICEVPILLAVLWSFVTNYAAWPLVIGCIPGLAVLAFELWPSARNLSLTENVLDSGGARSGLLESFQS